MPAPIDDDTARPLPPLLRLAVDVLHELQRSLGRETAAAAGRHNQYPRVRARRGAESCADRVPPVQRRVVRHQLAVPDRVTAKGLAEEEGLVGGAGRGGEAGAVSWEGVGEVGEAGGDGALVCSFRGERERGLQRGEGGGRVHAPIAVARVPAI